MRTLPHIVIAFAAVRAGETFLRLKGDKAVPLDEVDYRLVAAGSILPDHLDRTISKRLFPKTFEGNEHIFGHTLVFNGLLLLLAYRGMKSGDPRLLAAAAASLSHVLVDPVMRAPRVLLWPLLGVRFPHTEGWGKRLTIATQFGSAFASTFFLIRLQKQGRLPRFLKSGRLQPLDRSTASR